MALLEGRNLRKTYRYGRSNTLLALKGVDIDVERGEMVALMGPSGSGKSTLMHILGLLHAPDAPAARSLGAEAAPQLTLDGLDVRALSDAERTRIRARRMGFVFQDFNLVPTLTAIENVLLACEYVGLRGRAAREAALEALAAVDLAGRENHKPAELSGGEQQRVAIARAIVNKPELILADEPTGNLDSQRTAEVLDLFRRFNREHGQTIVLVTHDQEVGDACDRIVHVRDGRISEDRHAAAVAA